VSNLDNSDSIIGSNQLSKPPGFDTSLDFSNLNEISPDEARSLKEWYETAHGDGVTDLTPFVGFLLENGPSHLKLYRAYAQSLHEVGNLPQVIVPLLFLHYYMSIGNSPGVLYEVVAARQWGATKQEVLETIGFTFVESGPFGGNTASGSSDYLASWDHNEARRVKCEWPSHWKPEILLDSSTLDNSIVSLLSNRAPGVLAALHARINNAVLHTQLNPILFILYDIHSSVARGDVSNVVTATNLALKAGVLPNEIIEVVGFGALYTTASQLAEIAEAIETLFPDKH
jgi:alkylhydroperoxidase/carboxymuconolactone decarboxylase family protein YurZ